MNAVLLAKWKDEQKELSSLRQQVKELQNVCTNRMILCIGTEGERRKETAVEHQV